jgi:hypothetical protein
MSTLSKPILSVDGYEGALASALLRFAVASDSFILAFRELKAFLFILHLIELVEVE